MARDKSWMDGVVKKLAFAQKARNQVGPAGIKSTKSQRIINKSSRDLSRGPSHRLLDKSRS
jgi:hypothetical protein